MVLQNYIGLAVKAQQLNAQTYINTVRAIARRGIPFPQLSYDAWLASRAAPVAEIEEQSLPEESITDPENVPIFWFVGAYWSGEDQTPRFLADGIWENGYEDRFLEQVKAMRPGEKIAIKASFTRKHDLPFETSGRAASVMAIKAVGTILGNAGNGQQVTVNWDKELNGTASPWGAAASPEGRW